jgi:uncharacterized protein YggE
MRSIARKANIALLAITLAALALVAMACATTSANNKDGNSGLPLASNTGTGGGDEKAALLQGNDFGTYASFAVANGVQQAGIWVSGSGVESLVPDIAYLTLGVESQQSTVAAANAEAATAMDAIFAVLKDKGVEDKDIRTTSFNIWPQYNYPREGEPILVGYRISNQVSVKIKNLDGIGDLIDSVVEAGGNNTRINSIGFGIDDDSEARIRAREAAVNDAKAKAQQFARLTDVTLGKLIYISENGGGVVYPQGDIRYGAAFDEASGAVPLTPISSGEMEVRVTVQAVFAIE